MRKEIVASDKVAPPTAPLSHATRFGNLVFASGRGGRNPATGELGKEIREQTRFSLEGIKAYLEAANSSLDNVLQTTCYLAKSSDFQAFNEVYGEYFPSQPPARATVGVSEFMAPGMLVEISAIACIA
jgi:2-iminobutanoate/2-iminopropanoate deaminase